MLTRSHLLALTLGALAASSTGCILTTSQDGGGTGGSGSSTSSTTTGKGSTSSTTTSSASTTTSSSTGGGCVGGNGTGQLESTCQMAAFPTTCPSDNLPPIAVATCHRGFQIYIPGLWEELQACFDMIPATTDDTCGANATANTQTCLTQMYNSACANADADKACNDQNTACTGNGEVFDVATCKQDLVPFSTAGLNAYIECLNTHTADPCAGLHNTCIGVVQSF